MQASSTGCEECLAGGDGWVELWVAAVLAILGAAVAQPMTMVSPGRGTPAVGDLHAAAAVMTLAELAEFTGIPETELRAAGRHSGESRSRRTTRGKSQRGKSTTRAARSRRGAVAPLPADTDTGVVDAGQSA